MRPRLVGPLLVTLLSLSVALPTTIRAQKATEADQLITSFKSGFPDLYALLVGLERAHGALYGVFAQQRGTVKESDVFGLMVRRVPQVGPISIPIPDREADAGYAVLGARGVEIIRRTHAFHREVLAILAGVARSDRERMLDEAVTRYLSRPDVSLPDAPKDMTILYDHPYTSFEIDPDAIPVPAPVRRKAFASLTGFVWAANWFQLAALEPFEVSENAEERRQGLKVVMDRFYRKLSSKEPPDAFPAQLPLTPCIAPGLIDVNLRAAAIIDNLNMMNEVLSDVLLHPKTKNTRVATDKVIEQFTDRSYRVVDVDDWITVALRHSIFEMGGPALGTMTKSERNNSGHLQHFKGGSNTIGPSMR